MCLISVLQFQFINSYLSLFYIGFYLKDMERLKEVRPVYPSIHPVIHPSCYLSCYPSILLSIHPVIRVTRRPDFNQTVRFSSPLTGPLLRVLLLPFCPPFALLSSFLTLPAHRRNIPLVGFQMSKRKSSFKPTWSSEDAIRAAYSISCLL